MSQPVSKFIDELRHGDVLAGEQWPGREPFPLTVHSVGLQDGVPTIFFQDGTTVAVADPSIPILLRRQP